MPDKSIGILAIALCFVLLVMFFAVKKRQAIHFSGWRSSDINDLLNKNFASLPAEVQHRIKNGEELEYEIRIVGGRVRGNRT